MPFPPKLICTANVKLGQYPAGTAADYAKIIRYQGEQCFAHCCSGTTTAGTFKGRSHNFYPTFTIASRTLRLFLDKCSTVAIGASFQCKPLRLVLQRSLHGRFFFGGERFEFKFWENESKGSAAKSGLVGWTG